MTRFCSLWMALFAGLALSVLAPAVSAMSDSERLKASRIRNAEIQSCQTGDIVTWPDGKDRSAVVRPPRFAYNPAGAPPEMTDELVAGLIANAINAWSGCGIGGELLPWRHGMEHRPDVVVIFWSEADSRGNFGLANLSRRHLALGPGAFRLLRERNPRHDFRETMQMVIAHEMGHVYGLMAHSRRCVDVTSYYTNAQGEQCVTAIPTGRQGFAEFRHSLPTACDLQRCRVANGLRP